MNQNCNITDNQNNNSYISPNQEYQNISITDDYIKQLPDLQNGPSSLIQGAPVVIQQVGIHNFRLPVTYRTRDNGNITLESSITGSVSLEAHKKGINMSRIMRGFYQYKDKVFSINCIKEVLENYKEILDSFESKIMLKFSYPIIQKSLRSDNEGYQYYDVIFEGDLEKNGNFRKKIHFDFVYSSACPCSYELGQHALQNRNQAVVPHSQRSVARISIEFNGQDIVWIEDLQELCVDALQTETQVIVKREDEQAFAELNASYLKFVEDAARLLYEKLNSHPLIKDFKIVASHQESLHSHDAIAVIVKGIPGGFSHECSRHTFNSLIHVPR